MTNSINLMANTLYFIHRFFPSLAQKMMATQSKKMLLKLLVASEKNRLSDRTNI